MHHDSITELTHALQAFHIQLATPYPIAVTLPVEETIHDDLTNFLRQGPYRRVYQLYSASGDFDYDADLTEDDMYDMEAACNAIYKHALVIAEYLFGKSKDNYPAGSHRVFEPVDTDFNHKEDQTFDGIPWSLEYEGGAVYQESDATRYWETDSDFIFLQRGRLSGDGNFALFVLLTATPKLNGPTPGDGAQPADETCDTSGKPYSILALQKAIGVELEPVNNSEVMDWFNSNTYSLGTDQQVIGLNLRENMLTDASMLAGFSALQKLSLAENAITKLSDITHLSELRELSVYGNLLQTLDGLEKLEQLTNLNFIANQISSLENVRGLTGLKKLYAHGNAIVDLSPLAELPELEEIGLGENQITDISVLQNLTQLKVLKIGMNKVVDLSALAHLGKLNYLEADKNPATEKLKPKLKEYENHLDTVRAALTKS